MVGLEWRSLSGWMYLGPLAMDKIFSLSESYIFASFSSCHLVGMSMTPLSSSSHSETESLSLISASFLPCLARLGLIAFMFMLEM